MIKVIDGKRYNTETAEELASGGSDAYKSDFRWYTESLYKTKKCSFFLAGEGNAMSKYAAPAGDMMGSGDDIIPLSKKEALQWCEQNDKTDVIEDHFNDLVEDA